MSPVCVASRLLFINELSKREHVRLSIAISFDPEAHVHVFCGAAGFDRYDKGSNSSRLGRPILFFGLVNVLESMFFRRSGKHNTVND